MEGRIEDGVVRVEPPAREQFHDAHGYGRPRGDGLALAPVEAAHLLHRGDLEAVDGHGLPGFLAATGAVLDFVVYRDLRERGFYVSPAREEWVDAPPGIDLLVHPRGTGPWDDEVAHRIRVLGERESVAASDLGRTDLAVVDEDGELTYLSTIPEGPSGSANGPVPTSRGTLLADRVLVRNPPAALHQRLFYGQRLGGRQAVDGPLLLSLLEAAYLAGAGALSIDADGDRASIVDRGRAVEGERFDRRLAAYAALRDRGVVPKSGFKFGTDFRAYESFQSVEDMDHSESLVRVVTADHAFDPRALSRDVRLATSVRKRTRLALVGDGDSPSWITVDRLTP